MPVPHDLLTPLLTPLLLCFSSLDACAPLMTCCADAPHPSPPSKPWMFQMKDPRCFISARMAGLSCLWRLPCWTQARAAGGSWTRHHCRWGAGQGGLGLVGAWAGRGVPYGRGGRLAGSMGEGGPDPLKPPAYPLPSKHS